MHIYMGPTVCATIFCLDSDVTLYMVQAFFCRKFEGVVGFEIKKALQIGNFAFAVGCSIMSENVIGKLGGSEQRDQCMKSQHVAVQFSYGLFLQ